MAGEQRKEDLFDENEPAERSWVTEAREMLPEKMLPEPETSFWCHTLTAFVRCLLEWSHILTDCEHGCGCWMLSCVLYRSICGAWDLKAAHYISAIYLLQNPSLGASEIKILVSIMCHLRCFFSWEVRCMSSCISDWLKGVLFSCRHRYIPVLVPEISKGMLASYGLPISTVLVKPVL